MSPGVVTLAGTSHDALSGVASAEISLDGGATWQDLALEGGDWSYIWSTAGLPDGTYDVYVRASDVAGNGESTAHAQVIVSNSPPAVELQKWFFVNRPGSLQHHPQPIRCHHFRAYDRIGRG